MAEEQVTYKQMAEHLDMSPSTLNRRLKSGRININDADKICEVLHIQDPRPIFFSQILSWEDTKHSLSEIEPDADGDTSKTYFMTETHIDLLVHTHRQKTIIIYKSHKGWRLFSFLRRGECSERNVHRRPYSDSRRAEEDGKGISTCPIRDRKGDRDIRTVIVQILTRPRADETTDL